MVLGTYVVSAQRSTSCSLKSQRRMVGTIGNTPTVLVQFSSGYKKQCSQEIDRRPFASEISGHATRY
ncbi:uncharacterized protein N7487_009950 [Penicillium crustosum]|uniref:uncharacterized protein n=1 Tax=Penicillium crustosum TaxID=36656 RepID=UPI00239025CD|nr:uncharacterized protein N7487_009950 [Penicillium crustosum]KAJ5395647.1 hypothetical protein N7487_009950 [Penicillium crustosum]